MDNKIYEKYELIDLAKYGSNARKDIHPKLYVAEKGKYPKGDMMDINLQLELANQTWDSKVLFYDKRKDFEKDIDQIPSNAIVFIKDESLIWANGKYYSGGGGGGASIDISSTPMYYLRYSSKGSAIPTDLSTYMKVEKLSASKTLSITLSNRFLFLVVPNNIQLTRVTTSRQEQLDLNENFRTDTTAISEHKVWIYEPVIAPADLTLTFTFSIQS